MPRGEDEGEERVEEAQHMRAEKHACGPLLRMVKESVITSQSVITAAGELLVGTTAALHS